MILKKPYAFLIKYFKVINLLILSLIGFVMYKSLTLLDFFNTYIKNGYKVSVTIDLDSIYTPFLFYFASFLIVGFTGIVLALLIHKKKPVKLYVAMAFYYLFVFFSLFYVSGILSDMRFSLIEATFSRSLRDILFLCFLPQIFFLTFGILRTTGFDIKKFDFTNDIKELNYNLNDNEEFEFNIDLQSDTLKRHAHRFSREMIYYYKENKLVLLCLFGVLSFVILLFILNNIYISGDVTYRLNSPFYYDNLQFNFVDNIITNLDIKGNVIDNDTYYVVVKTHIKNDKNSFLNFDYNNFQLKVKKEIILPTNSASTLFKNYCGDAAPETISGKFDGDVCLIYKVDKSLINKNMKIRISKGASYQKNKLVKNNIYVNLNKNIEKDKNLKYFETNTDVLFDKNSKKSKLVVKGYEIVDRYTYKYKVCDNNVCQDVTDMINFNLGTGDGKKLFVVNVDYFLDSNVKYISSFKTLKDFVENYGLVEYNVNGIAYSSSIGRLTPSQSNEFMVFEVDENILNASSINLVLNFRDAKYIGYLKR